CARRRRTPRHVPRPPRRCRRRAPRPRDGRPPRSLPGRARASSRAPLPRAPGRPRPRLSGARSAERALQLVEEAFVVAIGAVVACGLELLEQAALFVGQVSRHRVVDEHGVVAVTEPLEYGHSPPAYYADLSWLHRCVVIDLDRPHYRC